MITTTADAHWHAACPLCGAARWRERARIRECRIVECLACRLQFVLNRFSEAALAQHYGQAYFEGSDAAFSYQQYGASAGGKMQTFCRRLHVIERRLGARGRLLDVGCATGLCVQAALELGWEAYGMDVSAYAIAVAERTVPGRCVQAVPRQAPFAPGSFDVVTLFDCVEHVEAPVEFLRDCARWLRLGGLLVVETPDVGGLLAKVMGARWPYYRPPEHLVYLNRRTLAQALQQVGCQPEYTAPSIKTVTPAYVQAEMRLSNPWVSRLIGATIGRIPALRTLPLGLPTGSLWVIARKQQDAACRVA